MRIFACLSAKGGRLFCSNCEESLVCDICEGSGNEWYEGAGTFRPSVRTTHSQTSDLHNVSRD